MADSAKERVSSYVELGPKSRALLRRLVKAMEMQLGCEIGDPGRESEQNADEENREPHETVP